MKQPQAESYMDNVIDDKSLVANLKQSLNDIYGGKGKATGHYVYDKLPVRHASSGKKDVKSVSLFWVEDPKQGFKIVACGEHTVSTSTLTEYKLCFYGQADGHMKEGAKISLKK